MRAARAPKYSVKAEKQQTQTLFVCFASIGIVVFALLMAIVGLGSWLFYQHNPLNPQDAAMLATQPNRVSPFFVINELPVGASGLIIAAIFAAGISTLDSALATLAETTVNGFYLRYLHPGASEKQSMRFSRISVVVWGIILSCLAFGAGVLVENEGLLNLAYKVPVITYGAMLMIALCALFRLGRFPSILMGAISA